MSFTFLFVDFWGMVDREVYLGFLEVVEIGLVDGTLILFDYFYDLCDLFLSSY